MNNTQVETRKSAGLFDLTISSLLWGAYPLLAVVAGGEQHPLLYMTVWAASKAIGLCVYLYLTKSELFSSEYCIPAFKRFLNLKSVYEDPKKAPSVFNVFKERSIFIPFQGLGVLLFALGLRYVDPAVAAVIIESWPIFFVILMAKINKDKHQQSKHEDKYQLSKRDAWLNFFAFLAVTLVVLSNTSLASEDVVTNWSSFIFGIVALFFAIIFTLQSVPRLRQAELITNDLRPAITGKERQEEERKIVLFLQVIVDAFNAIVGLLALIILGVLGTFEDTTNALSWGQLTILFVGNMIITVPGAIFTTRGTIKGKDLRVQSIRYLTPAFSVLLIIAISPFSGFLNISDDLLSSSEIVWPWLVAGLLGVVTANILTHINKNTDTFGLTNLVIFLWLAGFLVYFRDEWDWWRIAISKYNTGMLEYYAFFAITATIFTLLVSFEVTRVEQRTAREKELIFWLLPKFARLDTLNRNLISNLKALNSEKDVGKLTEHYNNIRDGLVKDNFRIDDEIDEKLGRLTYSKQFDRTVSSQIAISLFAAFTIMLSLTMRPSSVMSLPAILVDSFAFLSSAVIAYLSFQLLDISNERSKSFEIPEDSSDKWKPKLISSTARFESSISISLIILVTISYICLYFFKWL